MDYLNYLDTSALMKLFVDEKGSDAIRSYFSAPIPFFTSSLCFGEVLGCFKREAKKSHGKIRDDTYYHFCSDFMTRISQGLIRVEDAGITDWSIFSEVRGLAEANSLDIADAFLIVCLERGLFSKLPGSIKPLFITADRDLAKVARGRGLNVWNCELEETPPSPRVWDREDTQ